ncbi:MAG: NAD(P)H-dependent glycerol-3-phosphate dehydrogenase [Desulfobulbaceae bacterium]|nr:NAD(P)H-dependent glycerol-3-phosphate dehydrogenase [Desulfobulbaceae bacterium]
MKEKVVVIGAGSWGTALALLLARNGHDVTLWAHRQEHVEQMVAQRENKAYLPGFSLPESISITSDLKRSCTGVSLVVMVVPSHVYRTVFINVKQYLNPGMIVVSATKGIENDSLMTMTQIMKEEFLSGSYAVLSGPSFAKEVAAEKPTAVTVAATENRVASQVQKIFFAETFRVYTTTDVIGVELGGPLKNIVAIAAGICDGLGYGTNTRAALITRGLAEITRLAVTMGANPLTMAGLAGLGDLVLTCTGDLSRNRSVGLKLGQGMTIEEIQQEMRMVAEGVKTTRSAWNLAKKMCVDMPILEQVYQVLYEGKKCQEAVYSLLHRDQKEEVVLSMYANA